MRENKKVLKFRKFKIANLQVKGVVGGTNSNPCVHTETHQPTPTVDEYTCRVSERYHASDCTKGEFLTDEDVSDCRLPGL
ncbi:hypothetical protein [uncultured Kordia sp.]|uniref:hypothetical protein n=1 Tax=uncultured Kordia sp. TaxID=507699 RepID=UPI00262E75BD|nr:hypothetical protein [uncultured Kordia sp.]